MPEREGVAGVQPAVRELVDGVERERVERLELAHAREVEEAVAADLAGDVPEQDAEHRTRAEHPPAAGQPLGARSAPGEPQRDDAGREQQHERQAQRRAGGERHRERSEQDRERPGERGRGAAQPERAGDDGAREQQDPGREREPQQRHRSSSSGIRPDASHAAASRYIRPRSSRKTRPRSRSAQRQQPPGALRVADAAVLGEEAQVPAHVLAEHAAAVRGAADVDALRARIEEHAASRRRRKRWHQSVSSLKRKKASSSGPTCSTASRRTSMQAPITTSTSRTYVVVEPAGVEPVQQARARRELAEEEVLGREPPERRDAAHRALQRAVRVQQPRADHRRLRMRVGVPDEAPERPLGHPGVGVQDQEVAARRDRHARVPAGGEPQVLLLDHPRVGKELANDVDRAVAGAVVDDDRLLAADAVEALLDPGQRVVGDDDGAGVRHGSEWGGRAAPPRAGSRRRAAPSRR